MKQTAALLLSLGLSGVCLGQGLAPVPAAMLVVDSVRYGPVMRSDEQQIVVPYCNGSAWGEARIEDPSGRLRERFHVAQGVVVGTCESYEMEGRMRTATSYGDYTPPTYAQYVVGWHAPHDTPAWPMCQRYFMGRMEGLRRSYDRHGRLTAEEQYLHGMRHGSARTWWTTGENDSLYLAIQANYAEGKLDGEWLSFWPDGQLMIHKRYLKGVAHGKEARYLANGKIKEAWHFQMGVLDSTWIYYPDGTTLAGRTWRHPDSSVFQEETYHRNGQVARRAGLYQGVHHGPYATYDSLGRLQVRGHFLEGRKQGRWEYRDAKGQVVAAATFDWGVEVGTAKKDDGWEEVFVFQADEMRTPDPGPPPMDGGCGPEEIYMEAVPQPTTPVPAALVPRTARADRPLRVRVCVSEHGSVTEVTWLDDLPAADAAALSQALRAHAWLPAMLGRRRSACVYVRLYRP